MLHALKTWPEFFAPLAAGQKTFDIRKTDDRTFKVGDDIIFQEYVKPTGTAEFDEKESAGYTGKEFEARITHIFDNEKMGVKKGFVILSFKPSQRAGELETGKEIRHGKIGNRGYYDESGTPRLNNGSVITIQEANEIEKNYIIAQADKRIVRDTVGSGQDIGFGKDYNDESVGQGAPPKTSEQ